MKKTENGKEWGKAGKKPENGKENRKRERKQKTGKKKDGIHSFTPPTPKDKTADKQRPFALFPHPFSTSEGESLSSVDCPCNLLVGSKETREAQQHWWPAGRRAEPGEHGISVGE